MKPRLRLGLSWGHQSLSRHEGSAEPLAPWCPSLPCNQSVLSCFVTPQESQLQGQPFFSLRGDVPLHPPRAPALSTMLFLTQGSLGSEESSGTSWRTETSPSPVRHSLFSQKPPFKPLLSAEWGPRAREQRGSYDGGLRGEMRAMGTAGASSGCPVFFTMSLQRSEIGDLVSERCTWK